MYNVDELNYTKITNLKKCKLLEIVKQNSIYFFFRINTGFVNTRLAKNLMEKIARCIECKEPVLLAG